MIPKEAAAGSNVRSWHKADAAEPPINVRFGVRADIKV
jgi:hypothetical protein